MMPRQYRLRLAITISLLDTGDQIVRLPFLQAAPDSISTKERLLQYSRDILFYSRQVST